MSERCELCGAKLRPDDRNCRECGAELPREQPDAPAHVTAVESPIPNREWTEPHSVPLDTDPDLRLESPPRRRGVLWVTGGLVLASVVAVVALRGDADEPESTAAPEVAAQPSEPASPPSEPVENDDCEATRALQGRWSFVTEVTGSRVVQSSGLNGFYTVDIAVEACTATAALTKTGYTARMYSEARVQHATAPLALDARTGLLTGTFALESSLGAQGSIEFSFVAHEQQLSGVYRQRGDRWDDAGLSGFLQGVRDGEPPRELVAADQPCAVRCNLACDTATRAELSADARQSCEQSCAADPTAHARCGDTTPAPPEHRLTLQGPSSRAEMCKQIGGCAKTLGKVAGPHLGPERLPEGWSDVSMLRGKREGGVRLALHGPQGWWLSEPLFESKPRAKLGTLRLYARQLSESTERRYVLGLARTPRRDQEAYVACRLAAEPQCVRVLKPRGALTSALPEGTLSVHGGAPTGVFSW